MIHQEKLFKSIRQRSRQVKYKELMPKREVKNLGHKEWFDYFFISFFYFIVNTMILQKKSKNKYQI